MLPFEDGDHMFRDCGFWIENNNMIIPMRDNVKIDMMPGDNIRAKARKATSSSSLSYTTEESDDDPVPVSYTHLTLPTILLV